MADQATAPGTDHGADHGVDHGPDHHDGHHHPTGWRRWLYSTNHKDIGTMYIVLSIIGAVAGGGMSLWFRMELAEPGIQLNPFGAGNEAEYFQFYNVLVPGPGRAFHP